MTGYVSVSSRSSQAAIVRSEYGCPNIESLSVIIKFFEPGGFSGRFHFHGININLPNTVAA